MSDDHVVLVAVSLVDGAGAPLNEVTLGEGLAHASARIDAFIRESPDVDPGCREALPPVDWKGAGRLIRAFVQGLGDAVRPDGVDLASLPVFLMEGGPDVSDPATVVGGRILVNRRIVARDSTVKLEVVACWSAATGEVVLLGTALELYQLEGFEEGRHLVRLWAGQAMDHRSDDPVRRGTMTLAQYDALDTEHSALVEKIQYSVAAQMGDDVTASLRRRQASADAIRASRVTSDVAHEHPRHRPQWTVATAPVGEWLYIRLDDCALDQRGPEWCQLGNGVAIRANAAVATDNSDRSGLPFYKIGPGNIDVGCFDIRPYLEGRQSSGLDC